MTAPERSQPGDQSRESAPVLRAYVIGQTPRPDLTDDLEQRCPGTTIEVVGALDGVSNDEIEPCSDCAYPLETRLRDGSRIVIDAGYVERRIQRSIDAFEGGVLAHLVLCAGPFPALTAAAPLLRPFDTAVEVLHARGREALAVLVPFEAQSRPAERKWRGAGFASCRIRALTEKPAETSLPEWISSWARAPDADVVVFDYVGFPSGILDEVAAGTGLPVIDLGHLTMDLLAETLDLT